MSVKLGSVDCNDKFLHRGNGSQRNKPLSFVFFLSIRQGLCTTDFVPFLWNHKIWSKWPWLQPFWNKSKTLAFSGNINKLSSQYHGLLTKVSIGPLVPIVRNNYFSVSKTQLSYTVLTILPWLLIFPLWNIISFFRCNFHFLILHHFHKFGKLNNICSSITVLHNVLLVKLDFGIFWSHVGKLLG